MMFAEKCATLIPPFADRSSFGGAATPPGNGQYRRKSLRRFVLARQSAVRAGSPSPKLFHLFQKLRQAVIYFSQLLKHHRNRNDVMRCVFVCGSKSASEVLVLGVKKKPLLLCGAMSRLFPRDAHKETCNNVRRRISYLRYSRKHRVLCGPPMVPGSGDGRPNTNNMFQSERWLQHGGIYTTACRRSRESCLWFPIPFFAPVRQSPSWLF